jgi:hypothetical protein
VQSGFCPWSKRMVSVTGTGDVLTLSACDFSRELDSGFNVYYAGEEGACDTLACMGEEYSTGMTCALNPESSAASFLAELDAVYYIEVVSFSSEQGFDQNEAGTNGFVRIRAGYV